MQDDGEFRISSGCTESTALENLWLFAYTSGFLPLPSSPQQPAGRPIVIFISSVDRQAHCDTQAVFNIMFHIRVSYVTLSLLIFCFRVQTHCV
jgi:hypothetical protein